MLLGVLMCLVVWSTASGINIKPKHLCREDMFQQLVADHSVASGRRISASTVRRPLHNSGLSAKRPVVCVPLNIRQRRARLSWAREQTFPGPDSDEFLYSLHTSPYSHWRTIQDVCLSGGNEALDIINPTLLKDTVIEAGQ
ncbi:HTH_Tnp_Tc3_2 domain-containing protein [Trichonephila clavipes]|nr:HTH_Tnp_Tc3_2 domain-containing protein [Trichonephila clavipes]